MAMKELAFKRWVRANWNGWSEAYEPRRGGGVGIPDLQIIYNGRIVPVELKVGDMALSEDGNWVRVHDVRPAQIGWHKDLARHGAISIMLVGVGRPTKSAPDSIFWHNGKTLSAINDDPVKFGRTLYRLSINPKRFTSDLNLVLSLLLND